MNRFEWRDVGPKWLGPGIEECFLNGKKVAKITGKFEEWYCEFFRRTLGASEDVWTKVRITVKNYQNQDYGRAGARAAVEHYLVNKTWPWFAKDHEVEDMMVKIENEAQSKRGSIMDQFFLEGDYY